MRQRLHLVIGCANTVITAAVLLLNVFFCNFAQAEDVDYGKIGWWRVIYRQVDNLTGCQASVRFNDQTEISIALIQDGYAKEWNVYIFNPNWVSWIGRRSQHTLFVVAISPNKIWRDSWSVNRSNTLHLAASIAFMNSIADAKALAIFDENKRLLTSDPLSMKDSEAAIKAVVSCVREHPPGKPFPPQPPPEETMSFSGTAFFVASNFLVTNNHVVTECRNDIQVRYPDRKSYTATISGRDKANDLALLQTDMGNQSVATFRTRARLGEPVATYGFPYSDVLSDSGNFTTGSVTSLTGLRNDSRFIQIQAPVQPGNSGGPVVDMSGSVIGVVTLRLNMMDDGGGVPQNVNFAIHTPIVANFLSANGITPKLDSSDVHRDLPPTDVAELAKKFTVQVYCEAGPPRTSRAAPPPAVSPTTAMEQKAKEFVLSLQARWSRPNTEALAGLDALYTDEVMYYGKMTKKADVIKEKQAFVRKFPEREYKPREPISVWCQKGVCMADGLVDFRAVDPVAKILSEGVASFEYQFIVFGDTMKISLETGEVKSRTRSPLSGANASQPYAPDPSASQLYSGAGAAQPYKGGTPWQIGQ